MSKTRYKRTRAKGQPLSPEIQKLMEENQGKGTSRLIEDRAWWLPEHLWFRQWIEAIATVDSSSGKEKGSLIELLRSDAEITPLERGYLVDLLERLQFNVPANALSASALELLRGQCELTLAQRTHLADLMQMRDLKRPAHPPVTPAYDRTEVESDLEWDAQKVRQLQKNGGKLGGAPMTLESAVDKVAPDPDKAAILKAHITGKRGSTRRMKARRP
jgi:hypothetical protein